MLFQLALVSALAASPSATPTSQVVLAADVGPRAGDPHETALAPPIFRRDAPTRAWLSGAAPVSLPSIARVDRRPSGRPVFVQSLTEPVLPAIDPIRSLYDPDPDPQLIEYSDGYFTRLTIHKWASYLMLPLFVGEFIVGQKLINGNGSDNLRNLHRGLAGGIAGLFVVNTVTGGLNTIEAWHDPEGRTRRTIHSALMLLADIGFVATAALANEREDEGGGFTKVSNTTHRTVAIASMSTALLGYSIMLPIFGRD